MSQQQNKTSAKENLSNVFFGYLKNGDFYIGNEPPVDGFATDAEDNQESLCGSDTAADKKNRKIYINQKGYPEQCSICHEWIVDPKNHYKQDSDDDRVSTLPPQCELDNGTFEICTRCGFPEVPGSDHHDDENRPCNPAGVVFNGGEAVMAKHQGDDSASHGEQNLPNLPNLPKDFIDCFKLIGMWNLYDHCVLCHKRIIPEYMHIDETLDMETRVHSSSGLFEYFKREYVRGCCEDHRNKISAHFAKPEFNGPYEHPEHNHSIVECGCRNIFSTIADNEEGYCPSCRSLR